MMNEPVNFVEMEHFFVVFRILLMNMPLAIFRTRLKWLLNDGLSNLDSRRQA
jgi:hypothetical protein